MIHQRVLRFWLLSSLLVACLAPAAPAQDAAEFKPSLFGGLSEGKFNAGGPAEANLSVSATFEMQADSRLGRIHVTAKMAPDWYIYSVTQPPGGPKRTEIKITTKGVALTADFQPDQDPAQHLLDVYTPPVVGEEHHEQVIWTAPIKLAAGVEPQTLEISVVLDGQVCSDVCVPKHEKFTAKFTGFYESAAATG